MRRGDALSAISFALPDQHPRLAYRAISRSGPTDFSLVLGGPLYQLFLRTRLAGPSFDLLKRRMIVITLVAWLPLLLLRETASNLPQQEVTR